MNKHLLIHGNVLSGKSFFLNALLDGYKNIWRVDCRSTTIMDDPFLFDFPGDDIPGIVYFADVNTKIPIDFFYSYLGQIVVNRRFRDVFVFDPKTIIIEYSKELKNVPAEGSFRRRFDIINTNTVSYNNLINYLNHNKFTGYKCKECGWNNCYCLECERSRISQSWNNSDLCTECAKKIFNHDS